MRIEAWFATFSALVHRLTSRERALMATLAMAAVTGAIASAAGAVDEAKARLNGLRATAAQREPAVLAVDARNARAWAITDTSESLAQVRALALVENAAQRAGMANAVASVDVRDASRGARIVVVLDGAYDDRSFGDLLAALGETTESLTPLEMEVDRGRMRLRMRIVALHVPRSAP